jgi:hypothetical protein
LGIFIEDNLSIMKLHPIQRQHLLQAATDLDNNAKSLWSEYWLYIPEKNKEYPFKPLVRRAYTHATGIQIGTDFFQSNDGYRQYIENKFQCPISFKVRDNIPFFSSADLELFAQYAGKSYNGAESADRQTGEELRNGIFSKTNTWARALNLDGFEIAMDNRWQQRGYFTRYSWARIFRAGDKNRKIFFTVGVGAEDEALIYKLDCHYRSYDPDNALTPEQVQIFNRIVKPTDAGWQEIASDELKDYNWESLIEATRDFIFHYSSLYDEVVAAVWNSSLPLTPKTGELRENPTPKGIGQLPGRNKRVAYSGNADYDKENKDCKRLGDKGESLVIAFEQNFLISRGKPELAAAICKVLDWEGYDILSFHPDGKPKYIEVKTTTGTDKRSFFWTRNEKQFMLQNPDSYCLYRLYNYDEATHAADFYKLEGDISGLILEEPVQYQVYIK